MTPIQLYQQDIANGVIIPDPAQAVAMQQLEQVYQAITEPQRSISKVMPRLYHRLKRQHTPIKGLYLWGGVGIGKTYMMDTFYQALDFRQKKRLHFHHFMQIVQSELTRLEGQPNPLIKIAKQFAQSTRVLCFDEFFVKDIADAMILANLLQALFQQGITLVATSNVAPDNLYHNGLQRGNFLPAIALLKKYTSVCHVDITQDYRLRHLKQFGGYFHPLNAESETKLRQLYMTLAHGAEPQAGEISINERSIPYRAMQADLIWFDFNIICHTPRSQLDYLVLAQQFKTVIVSNVPLIPAEQRNTITYLIYLVDIFYDNHVKLILSAAAALNDLYPAGDLAFEFNRTKSRLQEMQSESWISWEAR